MRMYTFCICYIGTATVDNVGSENHIIYPFDSFMLDFQQEQDTLCLVGSQMIGGYNGNGLDCEVWCWTAF